MNKVNPTSTKRRKLQPSPDMSLKVWDRWECMSALQYKQNCLEAHISQRHQLVIQRDIQDSNVDEYKVLMVDHEVSSAKGKLYSEMINKCTKRLIETNTLLQKVEHEISVLNQDIDFMEERDHVDVDTITPEKLHDSFSHNNNLYCFEQNKSCHNEDPKEFEDTYAPSDVYDNSQSHTDNEDSHVENTITQDDMYPPSQASVLYDNITQLRADIDQIPLTVQHENNYRIGR